MVAEIAPETTPAVQAVMILVEINTAIAGMHADHVSHKKSITSISATKSRQRQERWIGDQQHAPFAVAQKVRTRSISYPP